MIAIAFTSFYSNGTRIIWVQIEEILFWSYRTDNRYIRYEYNTGASPRKFWNYTS
jgi:hypothetical protein